jgi:ATP-dependent DNA helicase RecQ
VLICCFNRNAAVELRRRLSDLVGDDARGVTVLTYHALALRLLGHSFSARATKEREIDFNALVQSATRSLRGEQAPAGFEPDEARDRLLGGFQFILVDEYQDIDEPQYEMISAIAGRTLQDPDLKLSILAVGDDDQNIYTFRGANVRFIRRFQQDYEAEVHYLVENYRSTRCIIEVANCLIAANVDRMKTSHPVRIDRQRQMLAAGGDFGQRDRLCQGKVQLIEVADVASQARAVMAELRRLRQLGVSDWSTIAVLSREHTDLAQVRTLAEQESIPVRWVAGRDTMPPLHHIREIDLFLTELGKHRVEFRRASDLERMAPELTKSDGNNPWTQFLARLLEAWRTESGDAELPVQDALEFLYEACSESRREFTYGEGVTLCTVHSAKGTEFDHVLVIGPWRLALNSIAQEEERRTFYVGLTRARKTLAVFDRADVRPSLSETLTDRGVIRLRFREETPRQQIPVLSYEVLSLEDIHLGYPGRLGREHPIHKALSALNVGDKVTMRSFAGKGVGLIRDPDICVARLSHKAEQIWSPRISKVREVRILAMVRRTAEQDTKAERREGYNVPGWEVPIAEVVFEPTAPDSLS